MTYQPISDFSYLLPVSFIVGAVLILVVGIVMGFKSLVAFDEPNSKLAPTIGLVGIIALIAGFANLDISYDRSEERNMTSATENLKSKYDLKEINWESKDTKAEPTSTSGDDELSVEANDGRLYIFKYRVDKGSGEPFLKDMPISGQSAPSETATADSLLK